MTYTEAEDFLFRQLTNYLRTGSVTGGADTEPSRRNLPTRARILHLLHRLGSPHARPGVDVVHVAGTNGKGTVSTSLAALGTAAGRRTGLTTSPHYVHFRERFRIDGNMIEEADVSDFVEKHADDLLAVKASFFEASAALSFWAFARYETNLIILETGLGGTWDASNVLAPALSVITNIGLDHEEVLGDTLERIAAEKAGIIKAYTPCVIGQRQPETWPVFHALAAGLQAPLHLADDLVRVGATDAARFELSLIVEGAPDELINVHAPHLDGPFARENLRTAAAAWTVLAKAVGLPPLSACVEGLTHLHKAGYQGRYQVVATEPRVIVDAGHNPEAWSRVLPEVVRTTNGRLHVVCGFKSQRAVSPFFELLPPASLCYVAEASVLAQSAVEVVKLADTYCTYSHAYASPADAYTNAVQAAEPGDTIFVGGSSYFAGDVLAYLASSRD